MFSDSGLTKIGAMLVLAIASGVTHADFSRQSRSLQTSSLGASNAVEQPGSLAGRIRVEGVPPRLPLLRVHKHTAFCGSHVPNERLVAGREGGLQNVVVTVYAKEPQEMGTASPGREITLDNKDCRFVPHVQAAQVGTTVLLLNSDGILHDAHAFIGSDTIFNEGLPRWRKVRKTLARPGVVKILCELHRAWMSAYIIVATTPYFAVTDREGSFLIDGIPAGTYSVQLWHESLGEFSTNVVIEPGKPSKLEVSFPCPVCG